MVGQPGTPPPVNGRAAGNPTPGTWGPFREGSRRRGGVLATVHRGASPQGRLSTGGALQESSTVGSSIVGPFIRRTLHRVGRCRLESSLTNGLSAVYPVATPPRDMAHDRCRGSRYPGWFGLACLAGRQVHCPRF